MFNVGKSLLLFILLSFMKDPDIVDLYRLPTFHNLNHLELHLQSCCSWKLLTNFLNVSPNLESLVFENVSTCGFTHC